MAKRTIPASLEAERAVIGGILLMPECADEVLEILGTNDFYGAKHKLVFEALHQLVITNNPVDVVTLSELLERQQNLDAIGGLALISDILDDTPTAANVNAYARIVRDKSRLRALIAAGTRVAQLGYDRQDTDVASVINEAEYIIYQVATESAPSAGLPSVTELMRDSLVHLDEVIARGRGYAGLATGFHELDEMTSGLQKGNLIIIAGRPGMGKTTFAMNIAEHVGIFEKRPVLVFSLEMPANDLMIRMLASAGGINQRRIRNGEMKDDDWPKLCRAVASLEGAPIYVDDSPAQTPNTIRSVTRRFARQIGSPIGLIIVDYLQLLTADGKKLDSRVAEMTEISRGMKQISKEFNCPVIALSQLNRQLEGRKDKRPVASDLRDSGSIEQDADIIIAIYRDDAYDKTLNQGKAELLILKHRNGETGTREVGFLAASTRFVNLTRRESTR